jgi:hypothetical protein
MEISRLAIEKLNETSAFSGISTPIGYFRGLATVISSPYKNLFLSDICASMDGTCTWVPCIEW